MCKEFENNRKLLARLIYSKKTFTLERIVDGYKARKGNLIIDGQETIHGFITGFVEMGTLQDEGGRYRVSFQALPPLFRPCR